MADANFGSRRLESSNARTSEVAALAKSRRQYLRATSTRDAQIWKKAGVDARIHDARHTTGMATLRRTKNLRLVQELPGYCEIKTSSTFHATARVDICVMRRNDPRESSSPKLAASKKGRKEQRE
jgi:site-specific recombinase XerC